MDEVIAYLPRIIDGTLVTIALALCSLVLGVALGLLGAWAKLSETPAARRLGGLYTTVIRGVPALVMMLLLYYGGQRLLNQLGDTTGLWGYLEIDHFTAGVFVVGFIMGAYYTETFRGAFLSIPHGQIEAAIACGMTRPTIFRRIIWPQLVRYALPGFTNNWLVHLKETALVSVIGLEELVRQSFIAGRSTRQLFTFMLVALVIYLILTMISEAGLRWLDRRYSAGVRRA